jgi:hypothetical protein
VRSRALVVVALVAILACGGASDGPGGSSAQPAPDFTLELGEDGTFTLSEGAKPVYLVFWAEW